MGFLFFTDKEKFSYLNVAFPVKTIVAIIGFFPNQSNIHKTWDVMFFLLHSNLAYDRCKLIATCEDSLLLVVAGDLKFQHIPDL